MKTKLQSPRITHLSWGQIEVDGQGSAFKDAKLFPGGAREWDWRETDTRHVPGIQPADIEELLKNGAQVVILSRGIDKRLQVCSETLQMLNDRNITFHILQSEEAVQLYNKLRENKRVGGLFHSTC